jgi:hypothetical protein
VSGTWALAVASFAAPLRWQHEPRPAWLPELVEVRGPLAIEIVETVLLVDRPLAGCAAQGGALARFEVTASGEARPVEVQAEPPVRDCVLSALGALRFPAAARPSEVELRLAAFDQEPPYPMLRTYVPRASGYDEIKVERVEVEGLVGDPVDGLPDLQAHLDEARCVPRALGDSWRWRTPGALEAAVIVTPQRHERVRLLSSSLADLQVEDCLLRWLQMADWGRAPGQATVRLSWSMPPDPLLPPWPGQGLKATTEELRPYLRAERGGQPGRPWQVFVGRGLSAQQVSAAFASVRPALDRCALQSWRRDPDALERTRLHLLVDPAGEPVLAELAATSWADEELRGCLRDAMSQAELPASGRWTAIAWPVSRLGPQPPIGLLPFGTPHRVRLFEPGAVPPDPPRVSLAAAAREAAEGARPALEACYRQILRERPGTRGFAVIRVDRREQQTSVIEGDVRHDCLAGAFDGVELPATDEFVWEIPVFLLPEGSGVEHPTALIIEQPAVPVPPRRPEVSWSPLEATGPDVSAWAGRVEPEMLACYQEALEVYPSLQGTLTLEVSTSEAGSGALISRGAPPTELQSEMLRSCVMSLEPTPEELPCARGRCRRHVQWTFHLGG